MTELINKTVLPSGIRILTERMPHVRTAAMGIWVGAGSRYEPAPQHGITHFLEHLFFKGTEKRSALEIAQAADDMGGQMNAFTDREQTVFFVKVLSTHLEQAVEICADMLLHSTFAQESVERERQVIVEEIKSYEDSPDELVQDLFAQTVWNGHPLGRPVIGTLATVSRLTRDDCLEHVQRYYRAANVVVAVAGEIEHERVVGLIGRYFGAWDGAVDVMPADPPVPLADVATRFKETEQVHLCVGAQGLAYDDERRYALSVLDTVLGGGMSSRLFQEIRERRGLVYTIGSYGASYRDGGLFVIYAGMSPSAGPEVIRLTFAEIEKMKQEPPSPEELARAKESLKGSLMIGLESTSSRMMMLARSEVYFNRQITLDELIGRIDAVTAHEVQEMVIALLRPSRLSMAAIGPFRPDGKLDGELKAAFSRQLGSAVTR